MCNLVAMLIHQQDLTKIHTQNVEARTEYKGIKRWQVLI